MDLSKPSELLIVIVFTAKLEVDLSLLLGGVGTGVLGDGGALLLALATFLKSSSLPKLFPGGTGATVSPSEALICIVGF